MRKIIVIAVLILGLLTLSSCDPEEMGMCHDRYSVTTTDRNTGERTTTDYDIKYRCEDGIPNRTTN